MLRVSSFASNITNFASNFASNINNFDRNFARKVTNNFDSNFDSCSTIISMISFLPVSFQDHVLSLFLFLKYLIFKTIVKSSEMTR